MEEQRSMGSKQGGAGMLGLDGCGVRIGKEKGMRDASWRVGASVDTIGC